MPTSDFEMEHTVPLNNGDCCRFLLWACGPGLRRSVSRSPWAVLLVILCAAFFPANGLCASFGFPDVVEIARQLAQKPFQEPAKEPDILLKLNYDQWRNIRFNPKLSLWRQEKLGFEVQFFHPGFLYNRLVAINVVQKGNSQKVRFSPGMFHYGPEGVGDKLPENLDFAGFRLHYSSNPAKYHDEVIAFLGASYFRAVGAGDNYGLSSRGLAVDTAEASGEEFPFFREFWLVKPSRKTDRITIYALLDSPSATGGYKFIVKPGKETVVDVTAALFPRNQAKKWGIAPLTSMFFYGENIDIRPAEDFRPEVHDSDGLMIDSGTGEWIWRPLINLKKLLVTSFQLNNPKGFGLFQRDRNFDHYQDPESHYEKRPSAWIDLQKGWGKGRVELVEIPSTNDRNDNIVAYWVPEKLPATFSYEMTWGAVDSKLPPLGRVAATRTAAGEEKGIKLYLIDFEGASLRNLSEKAHVEADISVGGAEIVGHQIQKNDATGGWRLVLHVKNKEGALKGMIKDVIPDVQTIELRASLRSGNVVLTETWSYVDQL